MDQIVASFKTYLDAQGCLYELDSGRRALHFGMDGGHARWRCTASAVEPAMLAMLSLVPLRASVHRRNACAELCLRINWTLGLGHFDLDFNDGELRYTTIVPIAEGCPLAIDLIQHVVSAHRTIVDTFVPVFASVLFSETPPEKALAAQTQRTGQNEPRFNLN